MHVDKEVETIKLLVLCPFLLNNSKLGRDFTVASTVKSQTELDFLPHKVGLQDTVKCKFQMNTVVHLHKIQETDPPRKRRRFVPMHRSNL